MRHVSLWLDYLPTEDHLELIDEPNQSACQRIYKENKVLFESIPGSRHNHQVWSGGYSDHITECLNFARHEYNFKLAFGRPLPFSLSDVLLVLFLHDLEKPWRDEMNSHSKHAHATKTERQTFREEKFAKYGIVLTPYQLNGLTYVEGEIVKHSSTERVMNELASFCHGIDNWSARGQYDYPKVEGDEWTGATRFRST